VENPDGENAPQSFLRPKANLVELRQDKVPFGVFFWYCTLTNPCHLLFCMKQLRLAVVMGIVESFQHAGSNFISSGMKINPKKAFSLLEAQYTNIIHIEKELQNQSRLVNLVR